MASGQRKKGIEILKLIDSFGDELKFPNLLIKKTIEQYERRKELNQLVTLQDESASSK